MSEKNRIETGMSQEIEKTEREKTLESIREVGLAQREVAEAAFKSGLYSHAPIKEGQANEKIERAAREATRSAERFTQLIIDFYETPIGAEYWEYRGRVDADSGTIPQTSGGERRLEFVVRSHFFPDKARDHLQEFIAATKAVEWYSEGETVKVKKLANPVVFMRDEEKYVDFIEHYAAGGPYADQGLKPESLAECERLGIEPNFWGKRSSKL